LQPGSFDLVASVVYELGEQLHKSVFYNGTVEVVEASGFVSGETVFLITLGLGLLGLLGMWVYSQVQRLSKVHISIPEYECVTYSVDVGLHLLVFSVLRYNCLCTSTKIHQAFAPKINKC
jgi:translocon-associated protein subunit alpha